MDKKKRTRSISKTKTKSEAVAVAAETEKFSWEGLCVINSAKEKKSAAQIFAGKTVLLYFGALWCPPCLRFTPKLKKFYKAVRQANKKLEILFVSKDKEETKLLEYYEEHHGKWFYLEFGDAAIDTLTKKCAVKSIPQVHIVKENGEMIIDKGIKDKIMEKCEHGYAELFDSWQ